MFKDLGNIALITIIASITGLLFLALWLPGHYQDVLLLAQTHNILGPLIIISWRVLAIVIPPIPGGMFSLALIPIYGWGQSYLFALSGVLIGSSIAFFLARIYREPLVKKFVPLQHLHKYESKLSGRTEFLAFLAIRFTTSAILDFISYVAGLSKISYPKFIIATAISTLPDAIFYYLTDQIYHSVFKGSFYLAIPGIIFVLAALYVAKTGHFFKRFKKN